VPEISMRKNIARLTVPVTHSNFRPSCERSMRQAARSRGFEVLLVEPRQARHAPGRAKSDVLDCQWLQRLHSYGLLSASFRPAEQIVVLRSYLRQRQMLIRYAAQHVQHMQKALEQMNVKLTEVVSDVSGLTGMAIIRAILAGERNPLELAKLRNENCKRTQAEIARA
jgi:transposase